MGTRSVWLTSTKVVLTPLLTTEGNPFLLLTATDCSKASSIFQLGVLFGNLLIGPITDTKGRKIPFFVCSFLMILVQGIFHNQIVHALVHQVIPSIINGIHGPWPSYRTNYEKNQKSLDVYLQLQLNYFSHIDFYLDC